MQTDKTQYDSCNANYGSNTAMYGGFCVPNGTFIFTLSRNSRHLSNALNFEDNRIYYLASRFKPE